MNAWLATSCRLASSVLAMYGWLQWKRDCPPLAWLAVTYSKGLLHCSVAGIAIKESLQWKRGFSRLAVKGWLQWNRGWPRLCNEKMGPAKSVLRIHWFGASVENAAIIPCGFTLLSSSSTVNSSAPWAAPAPPNAGSAPTFMKALTPNSPTKSCTLSWGWGFVLAKLRKEHTNVPSVS